ncbi:hypothetical protein M758_1G239100 [Ceratodon purpureus]|nr:hypothetical protein M758_1G239100 [Ceratodon purpureus]
MKVARFSFGIEVYNSKKETPASTDTEKTMGCVTQTLQQRLLGRQNNLHTHFTALNDTNTLIRSSLKSHMYKITANMLLPQRQETLTDREREGEKGLVGHLKNYIDCESPANLYAQLIRFGSVP